MLRKNDISVDLQGPDVSAASFGEVHAPFEIQAPDKLRAIDLGGVLQVVIIVKTDTVPGLPDGFPAKGFHQGAVPEPRMDQAAPQGPVRGKKDLQILHFHPVKVSLELPFSGHGMDYFPLSAVLDQDAHMAVNAVFFGHRDGPAEDALAAAESQISRGHLFQGESNLPGRGGAGAEEEQQGGPNEGILFHGYFGKSA